MDASGAAHDNSLVMLEERVLAGACADVVWAGRVYSRTSLTVIAVFTHSTVLFLSVRTRARITLGLFE